MAHLSKKYAENAASFVSTKSRANFDKVETSTGGVGTTATKDLDDIVMEVEHMSKG
jgi:hypothetical protein